MAKRLQFRNHSVITYVSEDFLLNVLEVHKDSIKAFSYCVHDCDIDKESHIHLLLLLCSPLSVSTVQNWFSCIDTNGFKVNTFSEKIIDIPSAYDYLIHKDNPEKYQYNECLRIVSNESYFIDSSQQDDVSKMALFDLLEGVSLREVAFRYGRDFIYHYGHIKQIYQDILEQERQ